VVYREVGAGPSVDAQFEIAGWTDSSTGELLPKDEMAEQVRQTCDRILALDGGDILEFGCGTGLIIFPLAPKVKSILGIDISERALDHVRRTAADAGLGNIAVRQGSSEALEAIGDDSFDTVILNSTVQYFPSAGYLEELIDKLVRVTRPGGAIFLGDIRHLGLLAPFQAEILLDRTDMATSAAAVHSAVARKVEEEQELLVDPHWFLALRDRLPHIGDISIELKRGVGDSELARFRYDVVLHLGEASPGRKVEQMLWQPGQTVLDLIDRARGANASALHVRCIPNARVAQAHAIARLLAGAEPWKTAGDIRSASHQMAEGAISPERVWQACEESGLACRIGWSDDLGCFDAVLSREADLPPLALAGAPPVDPGARLTNAPPQGRELRRLEAGLIEYLEALLPDYMQPQGFVRLPRLPLTPNGKVDRAALATMLPSTAKGPSRAPLTELEKRLAAIFSAVLQVPQIGVDDDFFRLGGHSLKATQVISRIAAELGVVVPLRAVFESGTVAGLAAAVEAVRKGEQPDRNTAPIAAASGDCDIEAMNDEALARALVVLDEERMERQP
jgi:SAM-dependent methyltransferase/acyl carrier protein